MKSRRYAFENDHENASIKIGTYDFLITHTSSYIFSR